MDFRFRPGWLAGGGGGVGGVSGAGYLWFWTDMTYYILHCNIICGGMSARNGSTGNQVEHNVYDLGMSVKFSCCRT